MNAKPVDNLESFDGRAHDPWRRAIWLFFSHLTNEQSIPGMTHMLRITLQSSEALQRYIQT